MRVPFDQGTPVPLRRHLSSHHVETACERGWSDLRDSALPDRAGAEGFELPITTDRSLRHQRNPDARRLSVLVLTSTSRPRIEARVDGIVAAIEGNAPGECVEVPIRESVFGLVTKQLPRIAFGWLPCWPSCSMQPLSLAIGRHPVPVRTPSRHRDESCRCVSEATEDPGSGRGGGGRVRKRQVACGRRSVAASGTPGMLPNPSPGPALAAVTHDWRQAGAWNRAGEEPG